METQANDSKRLDDTLNWIISIYGQLDDRAKMEAGTSKTYLEGTIKGIKENQE